MLCDLRLVGLSLSQTTLLRSLDFTSLSVGVLSLVSSPFLSLANELPWHSALFKIFIFILYPYPFSRKYL